MGISGERPVPCGAGTPWPGCLFPPAGIPGGCSWPGREEEEEEEGSGLVVSTGGNGLEPLLALALRGNAWQLPPSPTRPVPPPWVVGATSQPGWWVLSLAGCQGALPTELHPSGWFS